MDDEKARRFKPAHVLDGLRFSPFVSMFGRWQGQALQSAKIADNRGNRMINYR